MRSLSLLIVGTTFLITRADDYNMLDFSPDCENLGDGYCDYEDDIYFTSWHERTQLLFTNMARMDPDGFETEYAASYACTTSTQAPVWWLTDMSQAARFHSYEMASLNFFSHSTSADYAYLFDDSTSAFDRILYYTSLSWNSASENIAAGTSTPLAVTLQWLDSSGHCANIYKSENDYLGVGYWYDSSSSFGHYWTQNFLGASVTENYAIPAGSHYDEGDDVRYAVQWYSSVQVSSAVVYVDGTSHSMSLLLGTSSSGTYTYDDSSWTSSCQAYYFKIIDADGASFRFPQSSGSFFGTYGIGNCEESYSIDASATSTPTPGPSVYESTNDDSGSNNNSNDDNDESNILLIIVIILSVIVGLICIGFTIVWIKTSQTTRTKRVMSARVVIEDAYHQDSINFDNMNNMNSQSAGPVMKPQSAGAVAIQMSGTAV